MIDIASDNSLKTFCSCSLSKTTFSSISTTTNMQYNPATCTCYLNLLPKEQDNETSKRNNYLRYFMIFYNHCVNEFVWNKYNKV